MRIDDSNRTKSKNATTSSTSGKGGFSAILDKNQSKGATSLEAPSSLVGQKNGVRWTENPRQQLLAEQVASLGENLDELPDSVIGQKNIHTRTHAPLRMADFSNSRASSSKKVENYKPLIENIAAKYDLDPHLVAGLIKQESNFNSRAVSKAGAMGLMQLMPQTARSMGVKDPFDPAQNIEGGSRYLRQMLNHFKGNIVLAIAAYNAGPGNVEKYGNRIPPFTETQNYVRSVAKHADGFRSDNLFPGKKITLA